MDKRNDIHAILDVIEEWEDEYNTVIENIRAFDLAERLQVLLKQARTDSYIEGATEESKRVQQSEDEMRQALNNIRMAAWNLKEQHSGSAYTSQELTDCIDRNVLRLARVIEGICDD